MFAHLIELVWRIYYLISFDRHELWKYIWFDGGFNRASFRITKGREWLLNDRIYLNELIFYCSICLKKRGQIADFNIKRVVWAWWKLIFYFYMHSFIFKVCCTIHRVYHHLRAWNQLCKRRSALNCSCKR